MSYQKIKTIDELKNLSSTHEGFEGFILLNGCMRSSKHMWYQPQWEHFEVLNEIDGSSENIDEDKFMDSFIGKAMKEGCLYKY